MTCAIVWTIVLLLSPIIFLLWLTESEQQRIRRLRSYGHSQRRIAEIMQVTRYRVRLAL